MMAPSYERNTAKIGEIHGTVNLGFKRAVHEGYMHAPLLAVSMRIGPTLVTVAHAAAVPTGAGNPLIWTYSPASLAPLRWIAREGVLAAAVSVLPLALCVCGLGLRSWALRMCATSWDTAAL